MALVHYDGELGKFDYDDTEFILTIEPVEALRYIGKETDGSKIHIPDGITDCRRMFTFTHIITPPVIPEGVRSCFQMFWGCRCLEEPPVIPKSVWYCRAMFYDCENLKTAPVIPEGVKSCAGMFCGGKSLKVAPVIPEGVEDCQGMFAECESLETAPVIPQSVKKECGNMFLFCSFDVENQGRWNFEHRGESYVEHHKNLEHRERN